MKKILISFFLILTLIIGNGCYWLFSGIQDKCVDKINKGQDLSLYETLSLSTIHLGISTIGAVYCKEAAIANLKMWTTKKDTIYVHSNKWITPKIKQRLDNNQFGKMAWNGDIDYSYKSPEKDGAILLNWCVLSEQTINNVECYTATCDYTWVCPSKTVFKISDKFNITLYEQLFYELEKQGILHPYKLICYYEK